MSTTTAIHTLSRRALAPLCALALTLAAGAAPADAAISYVAETKAEGVGAEMQTNKVRAVVDGAKARVEFLESGNPIMKKGSYLLTTDGAETMLLVNPKDEVYSKWDLDAMMGVAGGALKMARGFVKMSFSDPKVEKLVEEAGPTLHGLPTTHVRYRTSYTMEMSVLGRKNSSATVTEEDLWVTTALDAPALGAWLRKDPPKTGDENLDKMMRLEMGKVSGFPLKRVTTSTSTDKEGKRQVTKTTMEVTELDRSATAPPGSFQVPAGYEEQPLFPFGEQ
jgi:hypothetical protein